MTENRSHGRALGHGRVRTNRRAKAVSGSRWYPEVRAVRLGAGGWHRALRGLTASRGATSVHGGEVTGDEAGVGSRGSEVIGASQDR
jgi:hypothetical protein